MYGNDNYDSMGAGGYQDNYDAMMADGYGDEFGSSGWSGPDNFGMSSNTLGPAGDEDFSINERRRKMMVGIAVSVAAIVGAMLMLYAFASGMA